MDKRLTRWTAAALLLGSLTFLGGCSPQNTTVNPDTKKETAAADAKAGQKGAQASSRTLYRVGKNGKLQAQTVKLSGSQDKLPLLVLKELVEKRPQGDTTFPKGVKVNKVTVKDKVATIDFSREFQTRRGGPRHSADAVCGGGHPHRIPGNPESKVHRKRQAGNGSGRAGSVGAAETGREVYTVRKGGL